MCQKLSDPYAMLKALEQKERRSKMTYLEKMQTKATNTFAVSVCKSFQTSHTIVVAVMNTKA